MLNGSLMVGCSMGCSMLGLGLTKGGSLRCSMMMSLLFLVSVFMQLQVLTLSEVKMGLSGLKMYFFLKTCMIIIYFYYLSMSQQQQMEIQVSLHADVLHKADIVFYQAFTQLRGSASCFIFIDFTKMATFVTLIVVNMLVLKVQYGDLIICFILNLVSGVIGLIFFGMLRGSVLGSVANFITFATESQHVVYKEPITDASTLESCTSETIFVAQNQIKLSDLNEEGRRLSLNGVKNGLNALIRLKYSWIKNWENLYILLSFASMIYSIITLVDYSSSMQVFNKVILSIYVFIVGITNLPLVIVCLLIGLSPLICLGILIFCCCCLKNQNGALFIDVVAKQATSADIMNAGGDCSICYMNIAVNERIYVLPCSDKHVFHCDCLRHWTKVKNTCPICRKQIPMTDANRYSQPENQENVPAM